MTWLQRYRVRHYMRNAIWLWPVATMIVAIVAVRVLHWVEESMGWEANVNPETARTVLGALAGAMFTFIVFVCSSLLLVVQLASAQLTPRVIGSMFRDPVTKLTLAVFVFSFTFVLAAMIRIGDSVPLLVTQVAGYGCLASVGVFLYLIDHVGKMLRPSGAFKSVASQAHRVIDTVYPRRLSDAKETLAMTAEGLDKKPPRTVRSTAAGVVLAFDVQGLVALGTRHNCVIELAPQVGDFVAPGDALFRVYGGADLPADYLYQSIALGAERTMEQDPAFAFRVIVDIASKGLSPAINDPTTAVLAVDQIHHLLRHVGNRRLDDERVRDAAGRVRLIYRTPNWEDFVVLAVTEIRQFGSASIQIARRLRAMLENLIRTLPEARAAPLRLELVKLKRSAERFFQEPEDRALADVSDSQGVGGTREPNQPRGEPVPLTKDGKER
jgi:uncharacterized membrane protein